MDVVSVLHMNGGEGETSYAKNSYIPMRALSITRSIKEEAIRKLYLTIGTTAKTIAIADLGCSSRPDAVWPVIYDLIKAVHKVRSRLEKKPPPPNFTVYLNDLPGNDFNTILKSVPAFQKRLKEFGQCFTYCIAGSFYERLFENESLHFIHSSYSVHWLSRLPTTIGNNDSNIYISKTSPKSVSSAYRHQFECDLLAFLACRSEELVSGGHMVLTLIGRRSEDPSSMECCSIWNLLATTLNQMVLEGLIDEEKMCKFQIPIYHPSSKEIKNVVGREGSFTIDHLEVSEIDWDHTPIPDRYPHKEQETKYLQCNEDVDDQNDNKRKWVDSTTSQNHIAIVRCMRSVMEPILLNYFGKSVIEEVFRRYNHIVAQHMAQERCFFVNIIVMLCKQTIINKVTKMRDGIE